MVAKHRSSKKLAGLDESLYKEMGAVAKDEGKLLGEVLNEAMRLRLDQPAKAVDARFQRPSLNLSTRYVWIYMMRNNISTSTMAKKLGTSRETLSRVLNRKKPPPMAMALKLVKITGFSFSDLFPDFLLEEPK